MDVTSVSPAQLFRETADSLVHELTENGPEYMLNRINMVLERPGVEMDALRDFAEELLELTVGFKQRHPESCFTHFQIVYQDPLEERLVAELHTIDPQMMNSPKSKDLLRDMMLLRGVQRDVRAFVSCADAWMVKVPPERYKEYDTIAREGIGVRETAKRMGLPYGDGLFVVAETPGRQYTIEQGYEVKDGKLVLGEKVITKTGDKGFLPHEGRFIFFPQGETEEQRKTKSAIALAILIGRTLKEFNRDRDDSR